MSSLTYSERHTVKLDGKTVGEIRAMYHLGTRDILGYAYFPKGDTGGPRDNFSTLAACKRSLESA